MDINDYIIADDTDIVENPNIIFPALAFTLLSIAAIWPPVEFVTAGATFENLFWWYMGERSHNIVRYQCRKILVNRCCVACLPFIFALYILSNLHLTIVLQAYVIWAFIQALVAIGYCLFTMKTKFKYIRQMKELSLYGEDMNELEREITEEYNSFNNLAISFAHSTTLVITTHWFINISRFNFTIVNVNDVSLTVLKSNSVRATSIDTVQYLTILAKIRSKNIRSFTFRIQSDQFRDLQDRVGSPIGMARDIVLNQSLNERFVSAFLDCVIKNNKYFMINITELDPCFCCGIETPNVKIVHACERSSNFPSPCRPCNCRPIWCVGCLARIFAAKQAAMDASPNEWLDGQASCPTCRAEFCMLDIAFIETEETTNSGTRQDD